MVAVLEKQKAIHWVFLFVNRVTLRLIILARILEKHINKIQQFMLASKNM